MSSQIVLAQRTALSIDATKDNRVLLQTKVLVAILTIVLIAAVVACGPSKPNGSEYLGKWEATDTGFTGVVVACPLDISKNGESFVITLEGVRKGDMCNQYEGIFTLTPEGNLKGGPMGSVQFSFDKATNRVALSSKGLQYLKKR